MVSTAKAISYGAAKLEYDASKLIGGIPVSKEAYRQNLYGESPLEMTAEMRDIQQAYHPNLSRCFLDIVVSLSGPDADKVRSLEDRRQLIEEFMLKLMVERLGLAKRQFMQMQWIAYEHGRTDNNQKLPHWHILVNRVLPDGTVIPDSNVGRKAASVAKYMSCRYGLSDAEAISHRNRLEIRDAAFRVLGSMPEFSFGAFKRRMTEAGHPIREAYSKSGKLQGYYVAASSGTEYKASEIDRGLTLVRIKDTYLRLKAKDAHYSQASRPATCKTSTKQPKSISSVGKGHGAGNSPLPPINGHVTIAPSRIGGQSAGSNDKRLDDEEWERKRRKGLSM